MAVRRGEPGEITAEKAAAAAVVDGSARDRIRRELAAGALANVDFAALVPDFEGLDVDSLKAIAIELTARLEAAVAEAVGRIDLAALDQAIDAAARQIIDRSAVIEAIEKSGYRAALYNLAGEHHGYVTTALARSVGVPAVEVRKLAARGGMTNIARGLYRVDGIDGGDRAAYAEAVLRVGDEAHLVGESVLAFHELALVNPRHITVGTERRVRRDLPAHIRLVHSQPAATDITHYDGVRSVTVERAIRDSIGSVIPERLADAAGRAAAEGLLRRSAADALLREIGTVA